MTQKPLPSAASGPTQGPVQPPGASTATNTQPTAPASGPAAPGGGAGAIHQTSDHALPDPGANLRAWYPRWWLLSALCCSILVALIALLFPTLCSNRTSVLLCQAVNWTDWQQIIMMGCIWLLFLIGWLVAYIFGVGTIEVDRQARNPIAHAMRVVSEFETLYPVLYIYAIVSFWIIFYMWRFNRLHIIAFSICTIVIFVGVSCFMYRSRPRDRRAWLIGIVIFTLFCIAALFWLGPMQPVLLTAEIFVVLIGLLCFFLTHPNLQGQNPVQTLALVRANQLSSGQLFLSLLRPFFRRRRANQANPHLPASGP